LTAQEEFGDSLEALLKKKKQAILREQTLKDLEELGK